MVSEEHSKFGQETTFNINKISQYPMNKNNTSKDNLNPNKQSKNETIGTHFKKEIEKQKYLTPIKSKNIIHSIKSEDKLQLNPIDNPVSEKLSEKINTSKNKSIKLIDDNGKHTKIPIENLMLNRSVSIHLKKKIFQFHAQNRPFPPLAPDYPIKILKFVESKLQTQKKQQFIEEQEVLLECGLCYRGNLRFGKMDGFGKLYLQNVLHVNQDENEDEEKFLIYEGELSQNKIDGKGCIWFSGGERFEGSFINGLAHGHGKFFISSNKVLIEGTWIEGQLYK